MGEAVVVENLSISYRVRHQGDPIAFRRTGRFGNVSTVNALKDVSFSVEHGEVVGLVGGNGAGKSTLLRSLIGGLKPSHGQIKVSSHPYLLVPGLGFNRKLSGRENVRLGGLAAGLTKSECESLTEEIIDFADIGGFIDLPTTTYSSGMFSRLAFSVATHVRSEILLIDEALSAGDAGFRSKAVNKVKDMCSEAKTIIVVSHSSALVGELATRGIWLHRGEILADGPISEVADKYLVQHAIDQRSQADQSLNPHTTSDS